MLDPGHGGIEPGAVGPGGLAEKEVNLDVSLRAAALLRAEGVQVALTRSDDTCASLGWRVRFAASRGARLLVSIHHNADPDGPREGPGSETYHQYRSADSKRLAGLAYEEAFAALVPFGVAWVGDTDAGAKWRRNDAGTDYYGILRMAASHGLVATLLELAFVSNAPEEALLRREDVRAAEAGAVARAVLRYLRTPDPGSGFTTPYPRPSSGGPSRPSACVDPSG